MFPIKNARKWLMNQFIKLLKSNSNLPGDNDLTTFRVSWHGKSSLPRIDAVKTSKWRHITWRQVISYHRQVDKSFNSLFALTTNKSQKWLAAVLPANQKPCKDIIDC